jgi:pimeloyl-ACP methyl ester carboxylesterase
LAILVLLGTLGVTAPRAAAAITWGTCGDDVDFACAHLSVPLDRSGAIPGTISLALRRKPALIGPANDAVIALAGGPGQSAIGLAEDFAQSIAPALLTRDLVVFDQRGTGFSGALRCAALAHVHSLNPSASRVAACAAQIGPTHGLYTTADSVADIEAIRVAGGYRRLVLYGTSYGTKVALDYARDYPTHVESLVLDSTVPPDGPDVFVRSSLQGAGRVLSDECAGGACAGVTRNAAADLARLLARLRRGPLPGRVYDGRGRAHRVRISEDDIADILIAGDLDPALRAGFPAAARSALRGDTALLARLRQREIDTSNDLGVDNPLFFATTCEELPYPWSRSATPAERLMQARAAFAALPPATFSPFDSATALYESGVLQCDAWPFATAAPQSSGPPLPNVPTLILSGTDDLRTPTSDARAVAAQIPDAKVVVVPHTGHSVLGSDPGSCAGTATKSFFTGRALPACHDESDTLPPLRIPPLHVADVRPADGVHGRAGRTLTAVEETLADLASQIAFGLSNASSPGQALHLSTGGLRGGWSEVAGSVGAVLHRYSYVPGVALSGTFGVPGDVLRVTGPAAALGTLRLTQSGALVGTLGGRAVHAGSALGPPATAARVSAWKAP